MKIKKPKAEKTNIEILREIRDKISSETQNMTFEQLKKYIEEQLNDSIHPKTVWSEVKQH